jgi:RIO kinase 1
LGKNKDFEQIESLREFIDQGRIDDVLGVIKSGKEATVYLCEWGAPDTRLLAAKVYRSMDSALGSAFMRSPRNDAAYRHGRTTGSSRADRGLALKTRTGRNLRFSRWITAEYETMRILHAAGVDVPRPIAHGGQAVLMEYIADAEGEPAPSLQQANLSSEEAQRVFDHLIGNIQVMLANDRIHGDLSPFNVLYGGNGRVAIIDFPQAVDPRFNANAQGLLERDVDRVCAWAARFGLDADASRIAREMWGRFIRSAL